MSNPLLEHYLLELMGKWSKWEKYKDSYINKLLPQLIADPSKAASYERPLVEKIIENSTEDEVEQIQEIAGRLRAQKEKEADLKDKWRSIKQCFNEERFPEAVNKYNKLLKHIEDKEKREYYVKKWQEHTKRIVDRVIKEKVSPLVEDGDLSEARNEYKRYRPIDQHNSFAALVTWYEITLLLRKQRFVEADRRFRKSPSIPAKKYEKAKSEQLKAYLTNSFENFPLNNDQARAISKVTRNLLVTARAGAGKTSLLSAFTAMQFKAYDCDPDEIMILAFNKKAANEIRQRIQNKLGLNKFKNARTFHSLAWHICTTKSQKEMLQECDRTQLIQKLWRKILHRKPLFGAYIYYVFRHETKVSKSLYRELSEEDYYQYMRNRAQVTLRGEHVKSDGEKFIADFLFEHGIPYRYENTCYLNGSLYRPDFTLWIGDEKVIIEHWAINPKDPRDTLPEWWDTTTAVYRREIREKRAYWKERGISLIETLASDIREGRKSFEDILRKKLEKSGIKCEKTPQDKLIDQVGGEHVPRLTNLFDSFIKRAKQKFLSPSDLMGRSFLQEDRRTGAFLKLARRVYKAYQEELRKRSLADYEDLLREAAEIVKENPGDIEIRDDKRDCVFHLQSLKWILIDEYQDFSELFQRLIDAIRRNNPHVGVVGVGDDWQAINEFAGANKKFFTKFENHYERYARENLPKTYRCRERIVEASNSLMKGRGHQAQHLSGHEGGEVQVRYVDDVFVEIRSDVTSRAQDKQFDFANRDLLASRYLKATYEIISSTLEKPSKTSFAVLCRKNKISWTDLKAFEYQLRECFTKQEREWLGNIMKNLEVSTVHGFKGKGADVVIILRAVTHDFPLIHPDIHLLKPVGASLDKTLKAERCLFYVALTRAKDTVWILTEKNRHAEYLEELGSNVVLGRTTETLE